MERREANAVAVEPPHLATERATFRITLGHVIGGLPQLNLIELERGQADNMTSRDAADIDCAIITDALDEIEKKKSSSI